MFKKVSLFIILVVALLISGCADKSADVVSKVKNEATGSSSSGSSSKDNPLFKDEDALKDFEKDVKDKFGGFKVFKSTFGGNVVFYENRAVFRAVDPKNTKNVDEYTWTKGSGFGKVVPVKITMAGGKPVEEYSEYQTDMSMVNFSAIAKFAVNAEKAAKDQGIEGAQSASVIFVELESRSSEKRVFNTSIKGTRTDLRIYGDIQTGEVTSSKKSN